MFDPKWEHPLEMFSWQHFVALGVVLVIYLAVFFSRKFFQKNHIADMVFRYTLGSGLILFELILQLHNGPQPLLGHFLGSDYPLCGYNIWLCAIALFADSKRLMKLIYPLTITGGTLSLIVIDMTCTFPHFGAFQFWFVHAGFMLGALYYVFTKKIGKYTLKDLGRSFVFLVAISTYVLVITSAKLTINKDFTDPLFVIAPPAGLEFIKDALGQTGYTIVYLLLIVGVFFGIYGITYACTRKRSNEDENPFYLPKNIVCDTVNKLDVKYRNLIVFSLFAFSILISVLTKVTDSKAYVIVDIVLLFIFLLVMILNEMTTLYSKQTFEEDKKETIE